MEHVRVCHPGQQGGGPKDAVSLKSELPQGHTPPSLMGAQALKAEEAVRLHGCAFRRQTPWELTCSRRYPPLQWFSREVKSQCEMDRGGGGGVGTK